MRFVVAAVVFYAAWEGWLGSEVQRLARLYIDPILATIPHSEFLERLARVLGALGTLMTAAFGVYKGIYYADRNLPERLVQLLEWTDRRLLGDRQPLLAAITEQRPSSRAREAVFYVGPLNRALRALRFGDYPTADTSLREALRNIEAQMEVAARQRRNFEEQKVAAHILRGSIASARAEYNAQEGKSPDAERALAEQEFAQALELRPEDLDALELRGRQLELRGNGAGAVEDYRALYASASQKGFAMRAARACRLHGLLLEKTATPAALTEARRVLKHGLTIAEGIGSLREEEQLELGRIYGRVQRKRERKLDASKHLRAGQNALRSLRYAEARDLDAEATRLLAG